MGGGETDPDEQDNDVASSSIGTGSGVWTSVGSGLVMPMLKHVAGENETVFFSKDNVWVFPNPTAKNEGIHGVIKLSLIDQPGEDVRFSWLPTVEAKAGDRMIVKAADEGDSASEEYAVRIALTDIHSIRRHVPAMGHPRIVIVTRHGVAYPPLFLLTGGLRELFESISSFVTLTRDSRDGNVFLINDDTDPLTHSLRSLDMGGYAGQTNVSSASEAGRRAGNNSSPWNDVPWTILDGFSRLTHLARDATTKVQDVFAASKGKTRADDGGEGDGSGADMDMDKGKGKETEGEGEEQQLQPQPELVRILNGAAEHHKKTIPPPGDEDVMDDSVNDEALGAVLSLSGIEKKEKDDQDHDTFEMVGNTDAMSPLSSSSLHMYGDLKPRQSPVTRAEWEAHVDAHSGKIIGKENLVRRVFYGGIEPSLRREIWPHLLGMYSWEGAATERALQHSDLSERYLLIKSQWLSVSVDQEAHFYKYRERKTRIDKDVVRTDRETDFFAVDENAEDGPYSNPNLRLLRDVLMTYSFYNFDLGYVQGMSDLLAPILFVMKSEVDSFWCFKKWMEKTEMNFHRDQNGMHRQLNVLSTLVKHADPAFYAYLEQRNCLNMFFSFRWLLIRFKREFSFEDVLRLWEVQWSNYLTEHFHLFIALSILLQHAPTIMKEQMEFDSILKYVNELSRHIDLDHVLAHAEALWYKLLPVIKADPELADLVEED